MKFVHLLTTLELHMRDIDVELETHVDRRGSHSLLTRLLVGKS